MRNPRVLATIHAEQSRVLSGELANLSLGVLRRILSAPDGDEFVTVKLKLDAAKTVLDRAGHVAPKAGEASDPASVRDLSQMSIDELKAFVQRAEHDAAERAMPVIEGTATHDDRANHGGDDTQVIDIEG